MLKIVQKLRLAGIAGVMILGLVGCAEEPFMTVLYEAADGLQSGDEVVYKETVIGHVSDVALKPRPSGNGGMFHVAVTIDGEYHGMLSHQMDYLIESERLLGEKKQIRVRDASPDAVLRPVQQGDLVVGSKIFWQGISSAISGLVHEFGLSMEDAGDALNDLLERAEQALEGADRSMVDDLLRDLEDFTEEAAEAEEELLEEIEAYLKSL